MTRQTSKGTCNLCHSTMSKAGMTKHLETCLQKTIAAEVGSGGQQKVRKVKVYQLLVDGRGDPSYWMHLQVTTVTTLAALDSFLRGIWLECCGHLSEFEIGGERYIVDAGIHDDWGMSGKSMRVRLDKVFSPGQICTYEYDFGTTTELRLKVIAEREVAAKVKAIEVLARNEAPPILCGVCGQRATQVCSQCAYETTGWLCDACTQNHECGEEMMLPVVNSPRTGMCGYTGADPAYSVW